MRRRLLNLLTVLSLLVCVAVCVLWVRSYAVADEVMWLRPHANLIGRASRGRVWLFRFTSEAAVLNQGAAKVTRGTAGPFDVPEAPRGPQDLHVHSPAFTGSRRQHVTPEPQPISRGSMFHAMPLWSTNTIPVNAARSSTGGRPRFPGRYLRPGSIGSTVSHRSSVLDHRRRDF